MDNKEQKQSTDPKKEGLYRLIDGRNQLRNLLKRFGDTPFCERNKGFYYAAAAFSLFVHLISIGGSFYGLYWLASFMSPNPIFIIPLTGGILIVVEWAKRKSSDNFWDKYHISKRVLGGWLGFSFFLFCISAALSALGTYQGIQDFAPEPQAIAQDSTVTYLEQQIAVIDKSIENAENTRWKGTTTSHATKNIAKLEDQKAPLIAEVTAQKLKLQKKNERLETVHGATVTEVAIAMVLIYLLIELLFELCMSFCSYYDMRKMLEHLNENPSEALAMIGGRTQAPHPAQSAARNLGVFSDEREVAPSEIFALLQEIKQGQQHNYKQPPRVPGFLTEAQKKELSEGSKTSAKLPQAKTAETVVKQAFQPETGFFKQQQNSLPLEAETKIVKTDSEERYLRQRFTQAHRRYHRQENKQTPEKNLREFGEKLSSLGYRIIRIQEPLTVIYRDAKGNIYGDEKVVRANSDWL